MLLVLAPVLLDALFAMVDEMKCFFFKILYNSNWLVEWFSYHSTTGEETHRPANVTLTLLWIPKDTSIRYDVMTRKLNRNSSKRKWSLKISDCRERGGGGGREMIVLIIDLIHYETWTSNWSLKCHSWTELFRFEWWGNMRRRLTIW